MPRRIRGSVAVTMACWCLAPPAVVFAHGGSPDFLSEVRSVTPGAGIAVEVLNRDDRLLLRAPRGVQVEIEGYSEEPYARIAADGTVEVNTNSPAYYLNQDRFQTTAAPAGLEGEPPKWKEVGEAGRFEWHDHRMHWMGEGRPPMVTDPDVETKVFDWSVPLRVDGVAGAVTGTLRWTPSGGGGLPAWAIAGLVVAVVASATGGIALQRRRLRGADPEKAVDAW
jgi:hypothetical protein